MRRAQALTMVTIVGLVVAGGVTVAGDDPAAHRDPPGGTDGVVAASAALSRYDGCADLAADMRWAAAHSPQDLLGGGLVAMDGAEAAEDMSAGAPASRTSGSLQGTSDTNVQVAGVDEPDLVENDGRRVFTVSGGSLEVVDATGPAPTRLASVPLDLQGAEAGLLLHEGRLLVTAARWGGMPQPLVDDVARSSPAPEQPTTGVWLFDVSSDTPTLVAELELEGQLVTSRGVDGTAHLVVAHRPMPLPVDVLWSEMRGRSGSEAGADVRALLADTAAQDWLPRMAHRDGAGVTTTGPAMACTDVVREETATTAATLQVATLDMHGGDALPEATTGLATDAHTVTASADRLVVATPTRAAPASDGPAPDAVAPGEPGMVTPAPQAVDTRLHLFDLGPAGAAHRASGQVPGRLLNQFAMSLYDGRVRVATTTGEAFGGTEPTSQSGVHVLDVRGDRLEVVGSVDGLGPGETIHSVRFLGDEAYVVTFRQTDPLYRIDLSDPTVPRVTGELKITGYSAYLHPLGPDRLLGIGQEATTEGRTTGTQVSIFDVTDPTRPRRASQVQLPGATSEAEWDHHAVLVHDDLLVLPFERWGGPEAGGDLRAAPQVGALVVELAPQLRTRGFLEVATDAGEPGRQAIRRALVVAGRLVTVSHGELVTWDAVSLQPTGRLAL